MQNKKLQIAVDGLSGAGKGTLARKLASYYQLPFLDTGRLYRCVACIALKLGYSVDSTHSLQGLGEIATNLEIRDLGMLDCFPMHGEKVAAMASKVSQLLCVRRALFRIQRQFAAQGAVLDGRDIGTVVLPEAPYKIFVTAALGVRAKRRHRELVEQGFEISLQEVYRRLQWRDYQDSTRKISPLRLAKDVAVIDTSVLTKDEALRAALRLIDGSAG